MLLRLPTNYTPSTVMATRRDGSKKTDLLPSVASHPLTQSARSSMSTFATKWGSNGKKEKKKKRERKGKVEEEGKKERKRKRKGKEQEAVLRKGNERNRKDGEAKPRSGFEPVLPFHGHATFHPDAAGYEEIDLTTIMHECYARSTREIDLRIYT